MALVARYILGQPNKAPICISFPVPSDIQVFLADVLRVFVDSDLRSWVSQTNKNMFPLSVVARCTSIVPSDEDSTDSILDWQCAVM